MFPIVMWIAMNPILRSHADQIVQASIRAALPDAAVEKALRHVTLTGRVLLVAAGKAAWRMAKTAGNLLGDRIEHGIVVTKYGHVEGAIANIDCYEAGHPVPDANSCKGTQAAMLTAIRKRS